MHHQILTFRFRSPPLSPPILSSRRSLSTPTKPSNLRRLTSRIVHLKRRRQLNQIFEEVESAKKRHGKLNTIVLNAVMDACVHCGDVDSARKVFDEMSKPGGCGVDAVSFGILLKGLGEAQRIDEAFQVLESIEQGNAVGGTKLTAPIIYGLLNALLEAGDMLRANGLVARYRFVLREESQPLLLYNLLIKGYTKTEFPLGALTVRDEILRQGLKPDKLTYNTLVFACTKSGRTDIALDLLAEMKEEAKKGNCLELAPDVVTYTTIIKGLAESKDLLSLLELVAEMKSSPDLKMDRVAYTAMVDALLACRSIKGALCIFGQIIKLSGENSDMRPKPHLYLSLMRAFAMKGDLGMVKMLYKRMWSDSVGSINSLVQGEAEELLMEAAINENQVNVAKEILSKIITKQEGFSWTTRVGKVAIKVEALTGFNNSLLSPFVLPQVLVDDPIEKYMVPFEEANPLPCTTTLNKAIMRFFNDSAVPVVDDWGSCIGIVHRANCDKLDAPLASLVKGPPPCVTTSTSVGRVIDLLLEKNYVMIVVVRNSDVYETSYSSSSRPVGVFTLERLFTIASIPPELQELWLCRSTKKKTFLNS